MVKKQKLELTWIGKENRPKLEPRILLEDPTKSHHAQHRVTENDLFDNKLIFGDNLLALKALEQQFTGKIKCIYIDPPYNTGSAFEHYDDGIEHSLWLSLMRDRLELLKVLLRDDGIIFVQIDDNEQAYLKVLMDEVFGRPNFISTIVWQKKYGAKSDSKHLSESHEFILCFAKNKDVVGLHRLPRSQEQDARYKNADNDPRGVWTSGDLLRNEARDYAIYPIKGPSGREHLPPQGTSWRFTKEKFAELVADNRIWFGESGNNVPRLKRFLTEVADSVPAITWWEHKEVGHSDEAKKEQKELFSELAEVFATPKPERLMKRILELGSKPGDWVLDSFAGSGTTGAVAHKMGRRWIMVELGDHCHTHIIPRLQKVIEGTEGGGVTEAVGWKGGGGFRYYHIAPSLLKTDKWGNLVINKEFNADMLSQAVCKLEGYTYAPSREEFGMFHAWAASLTSASLGRQVGAAICTEAGDLLATGCNEVPKAHGGLYWSDDDPDERDHKRGEDSNDVIKNEILADLLTRIKEAKWLNAAKSKKSVKTLLDEALADPSPAGLKKATLMSITEFGRMVHAEMAAIMQSARLGISIQDAVLFCTTFPCHNCTKHIVAAGVSRLIFIEPYPKSRASELHGDSVAVEADADDPKHVCFKSFVGVSPRQYFSLFSVGESVRKEGSKVKKWKPEGASPRLAETPFAYLPREADRLVTFDKLLKRNNLYPVES